MKELALDFSLLGKRHELVDLSKFFSAMFPTTDNEAIEIVQ